MAVCASVQISGNTKLLGKLMSEMKAAQDEAAKASSPAAAARSGAGSSSAPLPTADRKWMSDKDASHCLGCGSTFTFLKRKHHCRCVCLLLLLPTCRVVTASLCGVYTGRLCGRIYCADCSSG